MVVNSRDNCIVMAIPRYHGDFGFKVAVLFIHWFRTKKSKTNIKSENETSTALLNTDDIKTTDILYLMPSSLLDLLHVPPPQLFSLSLY